MNRKPFLRTSSGLNNLPKFSKSDLVAYTEGGKKSYSIIQIDQGEFSSQSIDIDFWKEILNIHGCTRKIYFKAIGSKTSGDELTQRIIEGKVTNTLIFKDKDLDHYLDKYISHPSIIYTKGYSWENDVFTQENITEIINDYIFYDIPFKSKTNIENSFKNLEKIGSKLIRLELIFRKHGIRFLTNVSGEAIIKNGEIDMNFLIKKIKSIAQSNSIKRPFKYVKIQKSFNFYLDCYGKIFESISYHLTANILKELTDIKNFSKEIFQRNALRIFFNSLKMNHDTYYLSVATNINAA
ncbi:hypothetical protein [Acinetobacter modestus]|uniref:DUF4435 domain-containing protein n=1 Tax=Acinetobacter modestus TaxID=1776740 RepID=A0ABN0JQD2_9GAMM|nr:hypothetical protein [Acinetobacter modestus]ENU27651.1 hypothetical protein F992_01276 [Acinetobacter modestus]GGA15243.1 hypothetical protein GCM10017554_09680 [Acinetobacter modestus]